jgi:hypothetical protein
MEQTRQGERMAHQGINMMGAKEGEQKWGCGQLTTWLRLQHPISHADKQLLHDRRRTAMRTPELEANAARGVHGCVKS